MSDDSLVHALEGLRSPNGVERARARAQLVEAGSESVPLLIPLLGDPEKQVRWETVKALAAIGSEAAAPCVVPLLEDKDSGVRWLAARALVAAGIGVAPLVLRRLIDRSGSSYLCQGALHVFRELSRLDDRYREALAPVVAALDTLHAADLVPEVARETLHGWSLSPEDRSGASGSGLQYLFDSKGDFIAFRLGSMVFDANADWVGWLPWDEPDVVSPEGDYVGTIYPDDRLYVNTDRPARPHPGFPGYPPQPALPPLPEPRGYGDVPSGAKDVKLRRL